MPTRHVRRRDEGSQPAAEPFLCACASARQVARVLTQLYDGLLKHTGIEAPQFALLTMLDRKGPCSQATLGRRFALDKTTISRNLRLLERNGLIASVPGADRRERQYALTTDGRRRLAAARPGWKKAQDALRAEMSGAEWDALFGAFGTVLAAARRARARRAAETHA